MHAKLLHATGTSQTLPYAIEGAHRVLRCSVPFSVATGAKAFETAAIEDDGGTKTATDGALSNRILCSFLASRSSGYLCLVSKPPSSETLIQKSPKT